MWAAAVLLSITFVSQQKSKEFQHFQHRGKLHSVERETVAQVVRHVKDQGTFCRYTLYVGLEGHNRKSLRPLLMYSFEEADRNYRLSNLAGHNGTDSVTI